MEKYDDANLVNIAADAVMESFYEKGYQVYCGIYEDTDNLHIYIWRSMLLALKMVGRCIFLKESNRLENEIRKNIISIFWKKPPF